MEMSAILAAIAGLCALAGFAQALVGAMLIRRFASAPLRQPSARPPVTLLKPLHGDEALLEQALASNCALDYPEYQIVFGVARHDDPALAVVEHLRVRFPDHDIAVVVDPQRHGSNGKIGNLINMLPAARHDILVIADSDIHVPPDYLNRIVAALEAPGVGLATVPYTGLPVEGPAAALGAAGINHVFLPSALLARALGRQDCLGATMALRRDTLARAGGLEALADQLADDNLLGVRVRALGLKVALAQTIPATTVGETRFAALWRHELRWARTIRALMPFQYGLSALQHGLAWAILALVVSGGADWALVLFIGGWALRIALARMIGRALHLSGNAAPRPWLPPVRDVLSFAITFASYAGNSVDWRGQTMRAASLPPASSQSADPSSEPIGTRSQ
jgi:ceramide glucosyltransferase